MKGAAQVSGASLLTPPMRRSVIQATDRAAKFEIQELFFSTTGPKGHITACNDVFLRIADYPAEEMLGAPHSIIRHPDMPRCVFKLLWDYLHGGRPIGAYVKNMTRGGDFYWVFALVFPIEDGFLSVRLKPSTETLDVVECLYAQLRGIEAQSGADTASGMAAATDELLRVLGSLGFGSYDRFMGHCLREELASRGQALQAAALQADPSHRAKPCVFDDLQLLDGLGREAKEQAASLGAVSQTVHRVALNSSICAARMIEGGGALGVLSEQVAEVSAHIAEQASDLEGERTKLMEAFEMTSFQVSYATLVAEMIASFREQAECDRSTEEIQRATFGATLPELSELLGTAFDGATRSASLGIEALRRSLSNFDAIAERFRRVLLTTRINHITGRAIAASLEGGEQYSSLLDEMASTAEAARDGLESLQASIRAVGSTVGRWHVERIGGAVSA